MRTPQKGDLFFTGFESDFPLRDGIFLQIEEVEGIIEDKVGNEGRSIFASDGVGYDCFWSKKYQFFVYGLDLPKEGEMSEWTMYDVIEMSQSLDKKELEAEVSRLEQWVNDLQSGMFINCVYCGHRYGPNPGTPVSMADVLKTHIEQCKKHPLSKAKHEIFLLQARVKELEEGIKRHREEHVEGGWWRDADEELYKLIEKSAGGAIR